MKRKYFNWLMLACIIGLAVFSVRTAVLLKDVSKCCENVLIEISIMKDDMQILKSEIDALDVRIDELNTANMELSKSLEDLKAKKTSSSNSAWDYNYVMRVVAAESMGEPLEGQMAVAQCVYETAKATGKTPEQVVKQPGQYASPVSMSYVNSSVKEACERVFINGEKVTQEPIRYFYSTVGGFVSKWHENSLEHVVTIGNHKFFKAKG